jgi:hypothetical protein
VGGDVNERSSPSLPWTTALIPLVTTYIVTSLTISPAALVDVWN